MLGFIERAARKSSKSSPQGIEMRLRGVGQGTKKAKMRIEKAATVIESRYAKQMNILHTEEEELITKYDEI